MASKKIVMTIGIAIATILTSTLPIETLAQFDCRNDVANLFPCYGYILGRDYFPSPNCCDRLEDVVDRRPDCLCEVVRGNGAINQSRFLQLPSACGVRSPSAGNCYYGNTPPFYGGTPPYFSGRQPYYYSGYSTKILNSLLVSVLTAATCALTLVVF